MTVPIAFSSGKCTTRICGQTASISVLLISGILSQFRSCTAPCRGRCPHRPLQTYVKNKQGGLCPQGVCRIRSAPLSLTAAQSRPPPTNIYNRTQIFCTTGAYVGALLFPQQCVLSSPCAATATDGSVVPRRRRCSSALQRVYRVLAAMFFYGLILWLAVQSDPYPAPLFAHFFWQDRKSGSAKQQLRSRRKKGTSGEYRTKKDAARWAASLLFYRLSRSARIYAGVVPQQPPSRLAPAARSFAICAANVCASME